MAGTAEPSPPTKTGPTLNPLRYVLVFIRSPAGIPAAILIVGFALFSFLSLPNAIGGFYFLYDVNGEFTWRTVVGILNSSVLTGIIVIAVTILMIGREFDLSVGPLLAIGGYVFGTLSVGDTTVLSGFSEIGLNFGVTVGEPLNPILALAIALATTTALGVGNGLIVTYTRIPSFIATLGTLFIFLFLTSAYSGSASFETTRTTLENREVSTVIYDIFSTRLRDINEAITPPLGNLRVSVFWMIGLAIIMQFVLTRTRFGNRIFAIGGNVDAAKTQGINIRRTRISGFALSGLFAGIAGVILFSQFLRVQGNSGNQQELFAIAGAVVGGTLLTGGFGSVLGGLIGVLTLSTIRSGVVLLSTPLQGSAVGDIPVIGTFIVRLTGSDNFLAIIGFAIVGAAVLNSYIRRRL